MANRTFITDISVDGDVIITTDGGKFQTEAGTGINNTVFTTTNTAGGGGFFISVYDGGPDVSNTALFGSNCFMSSGSVTRDDATNPSSGFIAHGLGYADLYTGTATATPKVRVHTSGNVSIGTVANDTYKLDVTGTGRFTGDVTLGANLITPTTFTMGRAGTGSGTYNLFGDANTTSTKTINIGANTPANGTVVTNLGSVASTSGTINLYNKVVLGTLSAGTTDTDKFLVSDAGTIKYRTGAEVLSDIGGSSQTLTLGADNQIPVMSAGGTDFEYQSSLIFTVASNSLEVGVDNTDTGRLKLYGNGAGEIQLGGAIFLYAAADSDTSNDLYGLYPWGENLRFVDATDTPLLEYVRSTSTWAAISNFYIETIANATTDTDKFLVSDAGTIKYRTGAELLSDIGAQASGNYLLDTTDTLTGTLTINGASSLNIGVNDTTTGLISVFGNSTTTGGEIRVYDGASNDTTNDYWFAKAVSGQMQLTGSGTSGSVVLNSTSASIRDGNGNTIILASTLGAYISDPNGDGIFSTTGLTASNTFVFKVGDVDGSLNGNLMSYTQSTGILKINTQTAATVDTDKFMVFDTGGAVKYRTGAELLSDIGAQASGNYLLDTTDTLTGNLTVTGDITSDGLNVLGSGAALPSAFWSEDFAVDLGDFTTTGDVVWARVTNEGNGDLFSALSGAIGDKEKSILTVTKTTTQDSTYLQYDYKTSTEGNFDFLHVSVDDVIVRRYSGTNAWTTDGVFIHGIASHKIDFIFYRDNSASGGTNQVWVDNVGLYNYTEDVIVEPKSVFNDDLSVAGNLIAPNISYLGETYMSGWLHGFNQSGERTFYIRNTDTYVDANFRNPAGGEPGVELGANTTDSYVTIHKSTEGATAKRFQAGWTTTYDGGYIEMLSTSARVRFGQATSTDSAFILAVTGDAKFNGNLDAEKLIINSNSTGYALGVNATGNVFTANYHQPSTSSTTYNVTTYTHGEGSVVGYLGVAGSGVADVGFANAFGVGTSNAYSMYLMTNDTHRVKIGATSGNVSIGNTNDTYKLDVTGTGRFTGDVLLSNYNQNLYIGGATDTGNDGIRLFSAGDASYFDVKGGTGLNFRINDTDGGTQVMRLNTSGNLSIGTNNNNNTYKLDVNGTGRFTGKVHIGTGFNTSYDLNIGTGGLGVEYSTGIEFTGVSILGPRINASSGNDLLFSSRGTGAPYTLTERMRINNSTGNVSIGNTNDTHKLDVSGDVHIDGNIDFDFPGTANTQGEIIYQGTGTVVAGDLYYLNSSSVWTAVDADAAASATGLLGIALTTNAATGGMLLRGRARFTANANYTGVTTVGAPLYASVTPGDFSQTAPTGTGDIVRIIGYVLSASSDEIYFSPDNVWVEII
jgi:hypothetical protein